MKSKLFFSTLMAIVMGCSGVWAIAPSDFAPKFKVDLDEELPPITELREQFRPAPVYDRKYKYYWRIGNQFDREFAQTIRRYGSRDRRLKWEGEDEFYAMIKNMDPKMYPYIGPYLHTVPGIPEKILNMPGIKETKNKFPTRIAPQVADIEDLEMLSPVFYFLLMPEAWKDNTEHEEIQIPRKLPEPVNKYRLKLLNDISRIIRPEDFAPGAVAASKVEKSLRTINPTENSPLTSPDIEAFVGTLDELNNFGDNLMVELRLVEAGNLLEAWEKANDKSPGVPGLKDLVNPCVRLVQKVRLAGLEGEFKSIIAKQGFNEKEWAYTCDKTVKAYRVLNMTQIEARAVKFYKKNVFEDVLNSYEYKYGEMIAATMQSIVEMYTAPLEDVLEVKKNYKAIEDSLTKSHQRIGAQTIYLK